MKQVYLLFVVLLLATQGWGQVRISQIYGGGGNSGSTWTNDFVELLNAGGDAVDLAGWSIQYASATGATWQVTPLTGTAQPLHYVLIQESAGGGGSTPLPAPDIIGTISMSATGGKIALVNHATALSGTCPLGPDVMDFVGFGSSASCFEGNGPAPAPSSTNAILRIGDGAVDTGNNRDDFVAAPPEPRNSGSIPLPVQLHTFSATVESGGDVRLTWATLSEVQNFGFEVQRSIDSVADFETVSGAFIPGSGTTVETRTYSYTDHQVAPGIWHYRLKQVDLNGGVHHSHALRVEIPAVLSVGADTGPVYGLLQNYPNPFNPRTTIRYGVRHRARVRLELFTLLGERVTTLVDEEKNPGFHEVPFEGTGRSSGPYICRLWVENVVLARVLLLAR